MQKVFRENPEKKIQHEIIKYMTLRDWMVKETHGNMYQSGFPDLYATHCKFGQRWIEVKLPGMKGSVFTPAQMEWFPKFTAFGAGVWILTGANEIEYGKLFKPANWWTYIVEKLK